jgi:MFS transporter, PAT family, beta-lactamase induction signal transducer AmpG
VPASVGQYLEAAPLAAFFLGISSGAPYAMIAATLTSRLKQDDIVEAAITAFALAFLVYNLKFLWAWIVDGIRLPVIGRLGQRVSWLLFVGVLVIAAIVNLGLVEPKTSLAATAVAAILVAVAGATFDIVIDAYRIELLEPRQLGVGSGMSQYGWRIGAASAAGLALFLAARTNWHVAYVACAVFALPAMAVGLILGEPARHQAPKGRDRLAVLVEAIVAPMTDFFRRTGAWLVLLFILLHKIGDTLANLTFRLLFDDLAFTNDEIAAYDVLGGLIAFLVGIFVGGILYARLGLQRSVLVSLWLMAVSNLSFAGLALLGHSNPGLAGAIGFENFASGIGGVVIVAYLSALCNLRFTAAHYALLSAAASVVGRILTGTTAGALIDSMGYVNFYLLTTAVAMPGILLFWFMVRRGLVERTFGSAATASSESAGTGGS